jgi:hypothetical protein
VKPVGLNKRKKMIKENDSHPSPILAVHLSSISLRFDIFQPGFAEKMKRGVDKGWKGKDTRKGS